MTRHLSRRQRRAGLRKRRNYARDPFLALPPEEQARRNARDRAAAGQPCLFDAGTGEPVWISLGSDGLKVWGPW